MQSIDELAREITALNPSEQHALLERVAQINLRRGLHDLAEKYRVRLTREDRLNSLPEKVRDELRRIREEIAVHEHPN
jgi:hypothetical protein